jgi:anti-sigma B factor antagonist
MLTQRARRRAAGVTAREPYNLALTRMVEHPSEHSSVDARGIRPPDAYAIEVREPSGGVLVLALEGEFDLASAPALRERLDAARATAARGVVLDFSRVSFVDSSGLRELLRAGMAFRDDGKTLTVAAPQPAVIRLFELTGATEAIRTAPTLERAFTLLAEQP